MPRGPSHGEALLGFHYRPRNQLHLRARSIVLPQQRPDSPPGYSRLLADRGLHRDRLVEASSDPESPGPKPVTRPAPKRIAFKLLKWNLGVRVRDKRDWGAVARRPGPVQTRSGTEPPGAVASRTTRLHDKALRSTQWLLPL